MFSLQGLLPDGIAFETFPASLSLPAESGPYPVNLLGTPRSAGELIILGIFLIINHLMYLKHYMIIISVVKLVN